MSGANMIPVHCPNCNAFFGLPSLIQGNGKIVMVDSKSGPCPKCGSMGNVINGTYEVVNGIIQISKELDDPIRSLTKLRKALRIYEEKDEPEQDLIEKLDKDTSMFRPLLQELMKLEGDFRRKVLFLIVIITFMISKFKSCSPSLNVELNLNADSLIEQAIENNIQVTITSETTRRQKGRQQYKKNQRDRKKRNKKFWK